MSKTTALLERLMWVWIVLLLITVGQLVWWSIDREPPFHVGSYTPTSAKPGQTATISANVERELKRGCSVQFSRYLYDPGGTRHDMVAGQFMTAKALEDGLQRSGEAPFGCRGS